MGRAGGGEIPAPSRLPNPLPQFRSAGRRRGRSGLPRQSGRHARLRRGEDAGLRGARKTIRRRRLRQTATRSQRRHGMAALAQLPRYPLPLRHRRGARHRSRESGNHPHPQRVSAAGVLRLLIYVALSWRASVPASRTYIRGGRGRPPSKIIPSVLSVFFVVNLPRA